MRSGGGAQWCVEGASGIVAAFADSDEWSSCLSLRVQRRYCHELHRPVASVSRSSRLGVSVLCAGNLGSRLPAARSLGFCRLCPWALASAPEFSLPFLAQPPGSSTPQVGLSQSSALQVSVLTRLRSPLPYCSSRSFRADAAAVRTIPRFYLPQAGRGARFGGDE
ncbi:hypothetical protein J1605_016787 [Eschrichtius robustus]|uniref:Uncharacterized protein n=1 Tax=Eschrichtius robustus TaxID=9764 RepID=A0AB34I6H7_ESCRO|nr:hypothetical protein J1605_016787 [Eschrichtius robustus]